jgi:cell division septal protein FtsQ
MFRLAWLVPVLMALLLVVALIFYFEKRAYQMQNRELLIQNDSILSVNIELKKSLEQKEASRTRLLIKNSP